MRQPKVVLVTDWIMKIGGGEMVVEQFHTLYPDAPIYASYCSDVWRKRLDNKVITGYLQHWPFSKLRRFLPILRGRWFARLDLSQFDIVISITGNGEAKYVKTNSKQQHICYCHTPVHFYWAQYDGYLRHPSMRPYWLARLGLKLLVKPLRKRDYEAAQQVDIFIANSDAIQQDIATYYDRDSIVVHPPVDTSKFVHIFPRGKSCTISEKPRCLWWGRIVPAKRLDIAIEACTQLDLPFTIIGDGPDVARLKTLAGPNITFAGFVSDKEREHYIRQADIFIFPSKEDFGVAPVEALAAGLPLVAYKAGGALDYVTEGENGWFFDTQTTQSLKATLETCVGETIERNVVQASVKKFSAQHFRKNIRAIIDTAQRVN